MSQSELKTPEDFVNYYGNLLKKDLEQYDIQVNKLGFLGYILNLLGWTNYDIKSYYDFLFKESFVATASSEENLYLHASIYGYNPSLATGSSARGQFIVNLSALPTKDSTIGKREIILSGGTSTIVSSSNQEFTYELPITIDVDGKVFSSTSIYRFVEDSTGQFKYYTRVISASKSVEIIPSTESTIIVPFYDFYQYEESIYVLDIPYYPFNSFYTHKIKLNETEYLDSLDVYVFLNGNWKKFKVQPVKMFSDSGIENVYLRKLSSFEYDLDFGSGIHGMWVPNTTAKIVLKVTKGAEGNLFGNVKAKLTYPTQLDLISYDRNGNIVSTTVLEPSSLVKVEFLSSEGGKNIITGDELRKDLLNFIQTRGNLITEQDFYNISKDYIKDVSFLFKKYDIVKNTFFCCRAFRDRYKNLVKTTNISVSKMSIQKINNLRSSAVYNTNYTLTNGTYTYIVVASNGLYTTQVETTTITINGSSENAVRLDWNSVPGAIYYIIYGRTAPQNQKWITTTNYFIDTGSQGTLESVPFNLGNKSYSFYPMFFINNQRYVSPYLYIYNSRFDWFEGRIFKDFSFIRFASCEEYKDLTYVSTSSTDAPPLHINLKYLLNKNKTRVEVSSYQNFVELTGPGNTPNHKLYISIPELKYNSILMNVDVDLSEKYYFYYEFDGLFLVDNLIIKCDLYKYETCRNKINNSGKTDWFLKYIYTTNKVVGCLDVSDQLVIPKFYNSAGNNLYINIPIIEKEAFDSDKEYFIDSISSFHSLNFKERRMMSDEIQVRFLNTINIPSEYIPIILKQNYYNLFKNVSTGLLFPLKLDVDIWVDDNYVLLNKVNLLEEKESIILELAQRLQNNYTGTNICFYNSKIIDVFHNRPYVKRVEIILKDSNDIILENGIEMLSLDEISSNFLTETSELSLSDLKLLMINYIPPYYWWNLDYLNDETGGIQFKNK